LTDAQDREFPEYLNLDILKPYFSITILECLSDNWSRDFSHLCRFLRREAENPGQAITTTITAELRAGDQSGEPPTEISILSDFGFEQMYALTRSRAHVPAWATRDSGILDISNELAIAFKRDRFVALRADFVSPQTLLRWVSKSTTPLQALPPDILMGTFVGDGRSLWLQGNHRQRATKADTKALYGVRLQEALDAIEDASYAMSAMQISVTPADDSARIRGTITISPDKSSMSYKSMPSLSEFLAVADEALGMFEKTYASESPPDPLFPGLALREKDLSKVHSAYDIRIATSEELQLNPTISEDLTEIADLLRGSLLDVTGEPTSPAAHIDVARDGARTGKLKVSPVKVKGGRYELEARLSGKQSDQEWTRKIRDLVDATDLLSIFYETGHSYAERRITRQQLSMQGFKNIEFADFDRYDVCREKPKAAGDQAIHDAIATRGDDSLFSWVVERYRSGWLLCDDGAGEIADFLHLDHDGTLSVIHVKGAHSRAASRRIAVTAFEELVSQAEKNVRRLRKRTLIDELGARSLPRPACWRDGDRIEGRTEFIDQLEMRIMRDRTQVVLVQPHLLKSVHAAARKALDDGRPTSSSHSLMLLDTLLHTTRRTVTSFWDEMHVIGCA
jgi:hypothetical protein